MNKDYLEYRKQSVYLFAFLAGKITYARLIKEVDLSAQPDGVREYVTKIANGEYTPTEIEKRALDKGFLAVENIFKELEKGNIVKCLRKN